MPIVKGRPEKIKELKSLSFNRLYKYLPYLFMLVSIGVFVLFQYPTLLLPYFWDELGVYARAALHLHDNNLSILPGAVPADLSRGHPTLFVFLVASVFRIAGTELWVGHFYPFLVSLLLVVSVFGFGKKHFNSTVGLIAALLLMVQPLFFAQTGLMLPEVQLALLCFLAINFYLQQQWLFYVILASLAVLTKETGIIVPAILMGLEGIFYLVQSSRLKKIELIKRTGLILIPWLVFGIFLIVQKLQNGWFFYPYHVSFIKTDWASLNYKLYFFSDFIFLSQGRWLWLIILVLGVGWLIATKHISIKKEGERILTDRVVSTYLFAVFIFFASFLFSPDMHRYTLVVFPFVLILLAAAIWQFTNGWSIYKAIIVCVILSTHLFYLWDNSFNYDADLDYVNVVKVQKEATNYLEKQKMKNGPLKIHSNFPFFYGMYDKRLGYLNELDFLAWNNSVSEDIDFVVKESPGTGIGADLSDTSNYRLHKRFQEGFANVSIYKVFDNSRHENK